MEIDVAFHKWHVVAGPVGGTVTSVDGSKTFCTIPEGGQGTFYATVTKVVTSDDSITVDEVENFNCAPVKLWLLGLTGRGVDALPVGYLAADFLESTGTQYIHTGILNTSEIGAQCESTQTQNKYNLNPLGARNMYLGCRLFTPFVYQADVWGIGYNDFLRATHTTDGFVGRKYKASTNFKNNGLAELDGATLLELPDVDFEGTAIISLFGCEVEDGHVSNRFEGRIFNAKLTQGVGLVRDFIPALDKNGIPCMYDKVTRKPFCNSGSGSFIVGMAMKQARKLGKLPNTGGSLTVSLPWEAQLVQHNSEVEAALETARSKGWLLKVQYREPEPDSVIYNKYNACTTPAEVMAVNEDYKTDLTNDGEWVYPLSSIKRVPSSANFFKGSPLKKIDIELPKATTIWNIFNNASELQEVRISAPLVSSDARSWVEACYALSEVYINAPKLTTLSGFFAFTSLEELNSDNIVCGNVTDITHMLFYNNKVKHVSLPLEHVTNGSYAFAECKSLYSLESELPELSSGVDMFHRCILNKESALRVLNSIPTWTSGTHKLTIGIHIDHQTDDEVLAAIEAAEVKGWTLTVQWNGTPTAQAASTYGLRRQPIFAKIGTMELPDGTSERTLEWGHYVTNWEQNGYQEFASVEEAEEYFGIEKEAV